MKHALMADMLAKQLALDYCCAPKEVTGGENNFHVFSPLDGRRRFDGDRPLKLAAVSGKLLCTGRADILQDLAGRLKEMDGAWVFETGAQRRLDEILAGFGCRIDQVHLFFCRRTGHARAAAGIGDRLVRTR